MTPRPLETGRAHARVQIGRGTASMSAWPASDDELDRYWPHLTNVWPAYQAFYDKGGRRSVFVLESHGLLQHTPGAPTSREPGRFAGSVPPAQQVTVMSAIAATPPPDRDTAIRICPQVHAEIRGKPWPTAW